MISVKRLLAALAVSYCSFFYATETHEQTFDTQIVDTDTPKQKARMRKHRNKTAKAPSTYREMTAEQLVAGKNRLIGEKNYTSAIKYLTQLIKVTDPQESSQIGSYTLEIADLLFEDKQYAKACQKYTEFLLLYNGHTQFEYGLYKSILSLFKCTLPCDRDQTKTEETLALTNDYLSRDHFVTYKEEVEAIAKECRERLAKSDLNICTYYLKRGNLSAAEKQISFAKAQWLEKCPSCADEILALESSIKDQKDALLALQEKTAAVSDSKVTMTERF